MLDTAFKLTLQRSGRSLDVAADTTILETVIAAGVEVSYSCMQGLCGTCETKVISGTPDHRDDFLNDDERASNSVVMICCSRSLSPNLVLDL